MNTVQQIILLFREELKKEYDSPELEQIIFLVFEHVLNFTKVDLSLRKRDYISEPDDEKLRDILAGLKSGKPVQYVLGVAWFCGMKFYVDENVLIPRQETEELVEWIVRDLQEGNGSLIKKDIKLLDVGSGSGCISITLKKRVPYLNIYGLDISQNALGIAQRNALENKVKINWMHVDILHPDSKYLIPEVDIVVSNPPYVLQEDKKLMHDRVTAFEPHEALFVPADDPLVYYRMILQNTKPQLKTGGRVYFEINEAKGKNVFQLLESFGFDQIELKKDLNGRERMVKAFLSSL